MRSVMLVHMLKVLMQANWQETHFPLSCKRLLKPLLCVTMLLQFMKMVPVRFFYHLKIGKKEELKNRVRQMTGHKKS